MARGRPQTAIRALFLAQVGQFDEIPSILERFPDVGQESDPSGVHVLLNLFEASVLSRNEEFATALMKRFHPLALGL